MHRTDAEPETLFSITFQPEDMEVLHAMGAENVLSAMAEGEEPCPTDTFLWEREFRMITFPQPEVLHTIGKLLAYSERSEEITATPGFSEEDRSRRLALGQAASELAFAIDFQYVQKQSKATEAEAVHLLAATAMDADEWLLLLDSGDPPSATI